jgi:hypothetical protein
MMGGLFIALGMALAMASGPASACIYDKTFRPTDVLKADFAFVGIATSMTPVEGSNYSILTFAILEQIKGNLTDSIDVLGPGYLFANAPVPVSGGEVNIKLENTVVAGFAADNPLRNEMIFLDVLLGRESEGIDYPALPVMSQPSCSSIWVRPATPDFIAEMKEALAQ